ncbi:hypothetical protein MMAD_36690 [Mycolicibacterium madagascariense]|uniref:PknH-like extracellular domain-containing protein n=1 Tax=Mycolicibacterium madagascariense TaxID=212765 RepID=A0A7I7XJK3_9MYCO|nr:sensor domain-containing protein [Mycolicibacterium madagascariense]MCV7015899.1 sensor domain-containing protein [Mycolicibacterium madagascariense]BBZ29374.1 hypothetical protein MMAD_36690 [Mycolicibacterium madagascariense]
MARWLACCAVSAILLSGCASTVHGVAVPATSALEILPTDDEISAVAGNTLSTFGFRPFVGGAEILPDGFRTDADASPIGCAAVTDTAPRIVYERLPVLEAARESYFNWDEGVDTSGADAAVIRLSTASATGDAFESFARQWQQCAGTTVVKHVLGTVVDAAISDVARRDGVVAATVRTQRQPGTATSRYERAIGMRGNTIVEVSLAITPKGERQPDPQAAAVRIAKDMLDRSAAPARP